MHKNMNTNESVHWLRDSNYLLKDVKAVQSSYAPFPLWEYETIALHYLKQEKTGNLEEVIETLCTIPVNFTDSNGKSSTFVPLHIARRLDLRARTILAVAEEIRNLAFVEWEESTHRHILSLPSRVEIERMNHVCNPRFQQLVEGKAATGASPWEIQRYLLDKVREAE